MDLDDDKISETINYLSENNYIKSVSFQENLEKYGDWGVIDLATVDKTNLNAGVQWNSHTCKGFLMLYFLGLLEEKHRNYVFVPQKKSAGDTQCFYLKQVDGTICDGKC